MRTYASSFIDEKAKKYKLNHESVQTLLLLTTDHLPAKYVSRYSHK